MSKILDNIKHLQTTAIGVLVIVSTTIQSPIVQQVVSMSPTVAKYAGAVGGIAAGLLAIFGVGGTPAATTPAK